MLSARAKGELAYYREMQAHYRGDAGPWLEHLVEDEGLEMGEARALLSQYDLLPYVDRKLGHTSTLIKRGKEVHFCIFRRYRNTAHVSSRRIKEFLAPILKREGFLTTKVTGDESASFIERLGFEPFGGIIGTDVRIYILNKIRIK